MKTLRRGDSGIEVKELQEKLKNCVQSNLVVDGIFGRETCFAVKYFQSKYDLLQDGVYGPQTAYYLNEVEFKEDSVLEFELKDQDVVEANALKRFHYFKDVVLDNHVCYGPGRGLFLYQQDQNTGNWPEEGKWIITWGPGSLNFKKWKGSNLGPSLHCTSLVNMLMSFLINRNDNYTHAGNIPSLFTLLDKNSTIHSQVDGGNYRGFSPRGLRIISDGDTLTRGSVMSSALANLGGKLSYIENRSTPLNVRLIKYLDLAEIYIRMDEFAPFAVWSQSDYNPKTFKWNWDHHVGFFIVDNGKLYRFAADGYVNKGKYSCTPVSFKEITLEMAINNEKQLFQVFSFETYPLEFDVECPLILEP